MHAGRDTASRKQMADMYRFLNEPAAAVNPAITGITQLL